MEKNERSQSSNRSPVPDHTPESIARAKARGYLPALPTHISYLREPLPLATEEEVQVAAQQPDFSPVNTSYPSAPKSPAKP